MPDNDVPIDESEQYLPLGQCYTGLLTRRIKRILLVGSSYDAFILREAGFSDRPPDPRLPLPQQMPECIAVTTGAAALDFLQTNSVDFVLSDYTTGDMTGFELGRTIKSRQPAPLVVVLTSRPEGMRSSLENPARDDADYLFCWTGDPDILKTIVWVVEDRLNADADLGKGRLRFILLAEDSPQYYSPFLTTLYQLIWRNTALCIPSDATPARRDYMFRSRVRVLLAENASSARELISSYLDCLIAVITDMQMPMGGILDEYAGLKLLRQIKQRDPRIPVVVLTREQHVQDEVEQADGIFLYKGSEHAISDLRKYMRLYFGFGDFVFRDSANREVARAAALETLLQHMETVPVDVFIRHASRNHFSSWLYLHGYHDLAQMIRPIQIPGDLERWRRATADYVRAYIAALEK